MAFSSLSPNNINQSESDDEMPPLEEIDDSNEIFAIKNTETIQINDREMKSAITIQRFYRSFRRYTLHQKIFGCDPTQLKKLSGTASSRMKKIIFDLAKNHTIIGEKIYHWTTWTNFKNIIRSETFLGNHLLKRYDVFFKPNALVNADIKNGDGNVICFCPYLVEPDALINPFNSNEINEERTIRKNLIRLTLDLNNIDFFGKYNQFFKLFDFRSPSFTHEIIISDFLSFTFQKNDHPYDNMVVSVHFKQNSFDFTIEKKNAISYGDLFSFNQFCLNKFLELINENFSFKKELNDYLDGLTDNELRKVLIGFGQGLTIFAEYNFNASLKLTDHLISQIYCAHSEKLFLLENLSTEQYQAAFKQLIEKGEVQENVPVSKISYLTIGLEGNTVRGCLYGFKINYIYKERTVLNSTQDIRSLPIQYFTGNQYVETRPGMDGSQNVNSCSLKFGRA